MRCRVIRTHYEDTISLNRDQIAEWEKDQLPMVVKCITTDKTLGILTWSWFANYLKRTYKKHKSGKAYLIRVSTFMKVEPMKPRVILRKAAA